MPTVVIDIAGTDYLDRVLFSSARFMSQVNGSPGDCYIRLRDPDRTIDIPVGAEILLTIDGEAVWRGFAMQGKRVYVFPALNVDAFGETRFLDLIGVDINVLFTKRIVFNQATPEEVKGKLYPPHTADTTMIPDLVADYLDLSSDTIDTSTFVDNVGDSTVDQEGRAWQGGDTWGQAMQSIAMLPAAIFYLRPTLIGADLVYCDVDTPDAPYAMSDIAGQGVGYREMEILKDGTGLINDQLAWGIGYGSNAPVFVRDQDAASQAEHGLWQAGTVRYGIYKQGTINRVAASIVDGSPQSKRGAKNDRPAVTVSTYQTGFLPSQKIDFTSEVWDFNDVIPIRKMEVTFEAPDNPKFALTLSHEIDAPFGMIDPFFLNYSLPPFVIEPPPPWPPFPGQRCVCGCGGDTFQRTETSPDSWGRSDGGTTWFDGGGSPDPLPDPSVVPGSAYLIDTTDTITAGEEIYRQVLPLAAGCVSDTVTVMFRWSAARAFVADLPFVSAAIGYVISSDTPPTTPPVDWKQYEALILGAQTDNTAEGVLSSIIGISMGDDGAFWALANNGTPNPAYAEPLEFTFVADDIYVVKVFIEPTQVRAKMWNENDAEPASWDFTKSMTDSSVPTNFRAIYRRGFHPLATGGSSIAGNTVAVHSVSVDKCEGVTGGSVITLDDFEGRTVANGWGTSSSGPIWTNQADDTLSVSGGQGHMELIGGSSLDETILAAGVPAYLLQGQTIDMLTLFKVNVVDVDPIDEPDSVQNEYRFEPWNGATNFVLVLSNEPFVGGMSINDNTLGPRGDVEFLFEADEWYFARWQQVYDGQGRAKIWKQADPEPDWMLTVPDTTPTFINNNFHVKFDDGGGNANDAVLDVEYIKFGTGEGPAPCYRIGGVDVAPVATMPVSPAGYGCEYATRISESLYRLTSALVAGTSRVFINGLRQRRGGLLDYTEDPSNGEIVFIGPEYPEESDVVWVCYYAAGPLV